MSLHRAGLMALICVMSGPSLAAPDFVPSPKQSFDGFTALNAPKADVPVGALWINGFGPTGEAAATDNLETERSLNGVVIDKGLQLSLTAGLFDLLGIEPRLRSHFNARFVDLNIVRVKDVSRLAGPVGEPRIVAALKAATIIVTTDNDAGLNARTLSWDIHPVEGQSVNGRTRAYSIEGRDLFIAVRVAVSERIRGRSERLSLVTGSSDTRSGDQDSYRYILRYPACLVRADDEVCPPAAVGLARLNTRTDGQPDAYVPFRPDGTAELPLPVPLPDGTGGLYTRVTISADRDCRGRRCLRDGVQLTYWGERLRNLDSVKPVSW